ncbi:MAG: hypothetical protein QNI84_15935 [Henriciella sp.]|nr:hypothetical protein [Henriciella sp.]
MSGRLLRVLQRGGCAAKTSQGDYEVWRKRDLRSRAIGRISGAEIEALRVKGALAVLPLGERQVLVWSGPAYVPALSAGSPDALITKPDPSQRRTVSLLQRVLNRYEQKPEQTRLAEAAFNFRADLELASYGSDVSGMNWRALSAGTRIDGGQSSGERSHWRLIRAVRRLDALQEALGVDRFRLLSRLIVDQFTRNAMASFLQSTPNKAEQSAHDALRLLADLYDHKVKRPDRVRLSV